MAIRYYAYNTKIFDCPCPCCLTWEECKAITPSACQMWLDSYVEDNYKEKNKTK
jgi:hypothetical protein